MTTTPPTAAALEEYASTVITCRGVEHRIHQGDRAEVRRIWFQLLAALLPAHGHQSGDWPQA